MNYVVTSPHDVDVTTTLTIEMYHRIKIAIAEYDD